MIKKTYKIDGMHCASCAMLIEGELEDIGVAAQCHWGKQSLDVEYDEGKINEQTIREAVQKAGYSLGS